ncbi:pseudouridine synthase [Caenispirillum bisanense]|uniref:pseudouridine synthase n=1 Tax=Caenispirillum bisanense TaxID=414052 RepID=UPI0031D14556
MNRQGRSRAASGQGRSFHDPVKRAIRNAGRAEKEATAADDAAAAAGRGKNPGKGKARADKHAKAAPSPRKEEPARASRDTGGFHSQALARPASRQRSIRPPAAPEREEEAAAPRPRGGSRGRGNGPAAATAAGGPRRDKGPLRYIAFHKPYGVLSQFTAESGQRALREFGLPAEVYAAGRLDLDSEGLLLLSNDGTFINRLLSPHHGHARSYLVQVEGIPDDVALDRLRGGVTLRDYTTRPAQVERVEGEPDLPPRDPPIRERRHIPTAWLKITLTEGRNRQVRRMTAAVGHPTLRLVRVSIGALELGDLPQGCWRDVARRDVLPPPPAPDRR